MLIDVLPGKVRYCYFSLILSGNAVELMPQVLRSMKGVAGDLAINAVFVDEASPRLSWELCTAAWACL